MAGENRSKNGDRARDGRTPVVVATSGEMLWTFVSQQSYNGLLEPDRGDSHEYPFLSDSMRISGSSSVLRPRFSGVGRRTGCCSASITRRSAPAERGLCFPERL